MVSDLSTSEIEQKMQEAWNTGIRQMIFSVGECSIRPDFLKLLHFAHNIGFKHIEITTNGRMFSYPEFARQAVQLGLHYFRFSLHGHNKELHDYLTRVQGSFDELVQGIRNIVALKNDWKKYSGEPLYVEVTTAVVKENYNHLLDIIDLSASFGVDQNNLNFVIPWGSAWVHRKVMIGKMSLAAKTIRDAIDYDKTHHKIIKKIANIPFCLLTGYEEYISEIGEGKVDIFNPVGNPFDYQEHRRGHKVLVQSCKSCKYSKVCEGVYPEYIELYGDEEFQKVV